MTIPLQFNLIQRNLRQIRAMKMQSVSIINVPVSQIYWKQSIKIKKNFLYSTYHKLISVIFLSSLLAASRRTPAGITMDLFEQHQGTHILQVRRSSFFSLNLLFK